MDYARIAAGLSTRASWVYVVLTLDGSTRSLPLWQRYRLAREAWRLRMRKALARRGRFVYVQTWERHRDGTPHVNLVLGGELAARMIERGTRGRVLKARGELRDVALRSGFGPSLWCEPVWTPREGAERPVHGLASYLVKLWSSLGGAGRLQGGSGPLAAELARADAKDQAPIEAPKGFRRFSATPGLLPPRLKGGEITGALHVYDGSWGWSDVEWIERRRERRAIQLYELCQRIQRAGLPLPQRSITVDASGEKGPLPRLRGPDSSPRAAAAPPESARLAP